MQKNLLTTHQIVSVFISARIYTGKNVRWGRGKDVFYFWTLQALMHVARSCLTS